MLDLLDRIEPVEFFLFPSLGSPSGKDVWSAGRPAVPERRT
jgi:hypothetical protein